MEYADEDLIRALNQHKKTEYGDIYTGAYIREELITFEPKEMFNGKVSMMLPAHFIDMPSEMAKIKYPMEQRPQVIKTNTAGSVNFAINLIEMKMLEEQITEVKNTFYNAIKRVYPANVFYDNKVEEMGKHTVGWFDFKNHGIDENMYNLIGILSIEEKILHVTFNCPFIEGVLWKPYVLQVLTSIEDLTEDKRDKLCDREIN